MKVSPRQLLSELQGLVEESTRWRELSNGLSAPSKWSSLQNLVARDQQARRQVNFMQKLRGAQWDGLTFDELAATIGPFAVDQTTPYCLLKLTEIDTKLNAAGLQRLLSDLRNRKPAPEYWPGSFDHAWMNSAIDELAIHDSNVKGFVGSTHIILDPPNDGRRLVIDTKFASIFTLHHGHERFKSGYLYQIYAYLRSRESTHPNADGMLLHPAIDQTV